jgi:hypothetical protein
VQSETAYQKGVDHLDLAVLDPAQLLALSHRFGAMLARAHGDALTADGVRGWTVIAPLIGDGNAFVDEVATFAVEDADAIVVDWKANKDRDLAALVLPAVRE